jgi:ubiquinone/menaquinone biosynthesis C-methylase UbiE
VSDAFERVAALYERVRPGYPEEAIAWLAEQLALGPGLIVLDLAAGTGKLTRELLGLGAKVVAVEPGDEMRAQLVKAVPEVEALAGTAEAIPLDEGSVDAVTVAQAFHWFRFGEALQEICRVLRPGGGLGLIWNERDPDDELQKRISELIDPFVPPGRPAVLQSGWREAIEADPRFGSIEERAFSLLEELDADRVAARIATISFIASAPETERAELEPRLRVLIGAGPIAYRSVTHAFVTKRVDRR